jgi:hypothetical protein
MNPALVLVFVVPLLALASWGALSARTRTEYNESTLIVFPVFGQPQRIAIRDFTRAGPISWRGHEFATDNGDKIYVNSIQTGLRLDRIASARGKGNLFRMTTTHGQWASLQSR